MGTFANIFFWVSKNIVLLPQNYIRLYIIQVLMKIIKKVKILMIIKIMYTIF